MTNVTPEVLAELKARAEKAAPGPWMRLFGERTVYDRMSDGCRGVSIVRTDYPHSQRDGENLDYIAAANPAAILALLAHIDNLSEQLAAEKAEHLKERERLDWALKNEANFAGSTLSWIDEIGQMQVRVVPSGALRETIDVLMGE